MSEWESKTERFQGRRTWGDPVRHRADLPDIADVGTYRYVESESAVYAFREGGWVRTLVRRPQD